MMDIESLAVSKVMERIGWTGRLGPCINVKDKEPMWDGHIYVYEDDNKTNKSLMGRIPVQVKGTQDEKKKLKYPVEIVDLKCYLDDGGIMYFVVYITGKDRKTTIFYASLLPAKIKELLKKAGEQKSISIELKELPDGDKEFEHIVFRFLKNKKRQKNEQQGENHDLKVLQENFKKPLEYLCEYSYVENDLFVYAENKDLNLTFPVGHHENINVMFFKSPECKILVNRKIYEYEVLIKNSKATKGEIIINIGKSFKFITNEKTKKGSFKFNKKVSFKFNINGYLEDRIKDYKFLLDFIDDDKGMYIYGMNQYCCMEQNQTLKLTKEALSELNRDGIEKYIERLKVLKKALDDLNVKDSLDLDRVTKEQEMYINILIDSFLHKEEGVKFNEEPPINGTIIIGNIKIMLFFIKMQDGRYKIYDFFRNNKINVYVDYKEKRYLTTRFSALKADDYLNISNIDFEIIEKEFKSYTNVGNYGVVNDSCLEMIRAYDIDNKRVDILDMAIRLYDWLIRDGNDFLMHVVINKFQCYKRKRELWDEEVKWLEKQLSNKELSEASIASIYTLLGNKESAKMHIEKFNKEDKQSFYGCPIESLYNKL